MTLNDLRQEVAALGFEGEIENSEVLTHAAKRALGTLYTEYGVICDGRIIRNVRKPVFHVERIDVSANEEELSAFGVCYSFTTVGRGYYTITDKTRTRSAAFTKDGEVHRGYIEGGEGAVFRFYSNYACSIHDLAVFDCLPGASVTDIPIWSPVSEYNVKTKFSDFASFASPPMNDRGDLIDTVKASGTNLLIPREFSGRINFKYKKSVPSLGTSGGAYIDLPLECEHLFPLLVAFYVWLDDDPEKAMTYMSLFREGLAAVKVYTRRSFDNEYRDVTGWA